MSPLSPCDRIVRSSMQRV